MAVVGDSERFNAKKTQASVTPAQGNGYTVQYKNPLFGNVQEQEFGKGGTGGYNAAHGQHSGGYTS